MYEFFSDLITPSIKEPWFFTEYSFLAILGVFLIFYGLLQKNRMLQQVYLICFSLFFYYKSSGLFLGLFVGVICLDYLLVRWMQRFEGGKRLAVMLLTISYSLCFLLFFKYANFFIENTNYLCGTSHEKIKDLFLPIGISFYTFQSISYVVDCYKKEIDIKDHSFKDYLFYMTFFPHLVAGPIVRAKDFLPQVKDPKKVDKPQFQEAMLRIALGLVKKLLIADFLAQYVDMVFKNADNFSGLENLFSVYAYTFQIYFDFSGYSDIAIGIALLLGFRMKENFNLPYLALNITEFWRRWHISLSFWLRDYIYIPLGGNRKGKFNMYLFLMITMLIGGFWHGASWNYIIWGALHGLALVFHKLFDDLVSFKSENFVYKFFSWFITFNFVAFVWIFFRAPDFEHAISTFKSVFKDLDFNSLTNFIEARPEFSGIFAVGMVIVMLPAKAKKAVYDWTMKVPIYTWIIIIPIVLQLILQFKNEEIQPFIYFQF